MITQEIFKMLAAGDVFYRGNTRYLIESITHRDDAGIPLAMARTSTRKSTRAYGQPVLQVGYVTFLHLRTGDIERVVSKNKVRKTRVYKSRMEYPFIKTLDRTPLEVSERNDCTVRALSNMLDMPYEDAHKFMQSKGRRVKHAFPSNRAYGDKGLRYVTNGNLYSFGGLLKSGILPERAIVRTNAHVVAVVNGTVLDAAKIGKNSKVYGWYVKHENA